MPYIAIDITIIPPDDVIDICVDLCQNYPDESGRPGLNRVDNLPHISLFMGIVKKNELSNLNKKLQGIVEDIDSFETSIDKLMVIKDSGANSHYLFQIKNTKPLRDLHKKLVEKLKEYHPQKSSEEMYFKNNDETIDEKTFFWVDNYIIGSSLKRYWPHITLKACKNPVYNQLPKKFTASRIVVCHMGNHCTCKKILYETNLK